jgi:hypothetical protein
MTRIAAYVLIIACITNSIAGDSLTAFRARSAEAYSDALSKTQNDNENDEMLSPSDKVGLVVLGSFLLVVISLVVVTVVIGDIDMPVVSER